MLDLSIIILNYNTQDWLSNCLKSIDRFPPKKISGEIIVVDNASSDGSAEMVKRHFPRVRLIESKENGGFAKGNNLGIKRAKGRYIMLLNSDTEFTPRTNLDAIVNYLDENSQVGVITPRLELPDGSLDLASHRGEPTPLAALTYFSKLEQLFPNSRLFGQYHQTWKNLEQTHEIEACSGAAMIVRQSALEKVGLLDEQFFMYAEDLDWCRRFRQADFKIVFFPNSIIIHHKYKSGRKKIAIHTASTKIDPQKFLQLPGIKNKAEVTSKKVNTAEYHFWETMKQYYRKHYASNRFLTLLTDLSIEAVKRIKSLN